MKQAALLTAPDGDVVSDRTARTVIIKADTPALAMTWSRYAPGEEGPALHVHKGHSDSFYVLDGELAIELGSGAGARSVRAGAGDFVLVPPGVAHAFRNEGPGEARFLNVHAPGGGFADYMRAVRDGRRRAAQAFDQEPPPPDGGRPASEALVLGAPGGRRLELGPGSSFTVKAGGDDGPGALALIEIELAPGFPGPVPHRHRELVDGFWVLDGTLDVLIGEAWGRARAGDYAVVPAGNVHAFANRGDEPVRALNVLAPGGFERYLAEVAAARAPGDPADPAAMAAVAARYDFEPVA
ncbi:MAG: hypothetical protein QOJ07_314 [Thermoleophilaceae bacterium]|nr:hypothetical protein [Thermoleophilaceae bacterium]